MTDPEVARRYEEVVDRYVKANRDALVRVPGDRDHVDAFAWPGTR